MTISVKNMRIPFVVAAVAAARKLGIPLWIMLREQIDYEEFCRRGPARDVASV